MVVILSSWADLKMTVYNKKKGKEMLSKVPSLFTLLLTLK